MGKGKLELKLSIFTKLFLILLLNLSVILVVSLASMQWQFKKNFDDYLLKTESIQLGNLVAVLEQAYQKFGNWDALIHDHGLWFDILRQGLGDEHMPPNLHPHDHEFKHFPPEPRHEPFDSPHPHKPHSGPPPELNETHVLARFIGSRVYLLAADKNLIAGARASNKKTYLRPIMHNSQTVGWLGLQSSELISDHLAQAFVSQQIRTHYLNAGLAIGLAILSSLLLTRKLLVPIKKLTAGANALVAGELDTRIAVSSQDELGQLARDFNLLAKTLAYNEQQRRQWLADISHELRTPLAILRGEIEAVQDGVRGISQQNIQSWHTEVMHLTALVNDLYELSITDLGISDEDKQPVELLTLVTDVISSNEPRFKAQGLTLRFNEISQLPVYVNGNSRRLYQLLTNVLENSRRYTTSGGFCEISLNCNTNNAVITVQDTAPGVPEVALGRLFDRLYRVEQSRNRELGGAGLGLSICLAIVKAHHGNIRALQSPHGGVAIEITLPLHKAVK